MTDRCCTSRTEVSNSSFPLFSSVECPKFTGRIDPKDFNTVCRNFQSGNTSFLDLGYRAVALVYPTLKKESDMFKRSITIARGNAEVFAKFPASRQFVGLLRCEGVQ